jgi:hypothetical protein
MCSVKQEKTVTAVGVNALIFSSEGLKDSAKDIITLKHMFMHLIHYS